MSPDSLRDLLDLGPDEEWVRGAVCAQTDPEVFFPERGESNALAKAVCAVCPVRSECLEYALAHNEQYGVWGGLSALARKSLVIARRAAVTDRQVAA